jgi:hypothetical protein
MVSATTLGPACHRPVPSRELVALGPVTMGPTPQMILPGFAGDRKTFSLMSPIPESGRVR